jgi:BirA family transcriptional regulator, biotin operon repressor / biotin---[acetyl-CoA-carboxylase] ligase
MEQSNLSPALVLQGLETSFIGQRVVYFPTLESTMDAARKEAQWGAPAGTVIIAEEQTAGRGRLQRTWISPVGALAVSVILRPNIQLLPRMLMLSALAVVHSIEKVTGLKASLKWPNDILIGRKKVAGILIENDIRRQRLISCIIGIGINVNVRVAEFPAIRPIATSLSDELGKIVSRLDIAQQLFVEMERLYLTLQRDDSVFVEWRARLQMIGQNVAVAMAGRTYYGVAEAVTPEGALVLRQADGTSMEVLAGDVSLHPQNP